MDDNLLPLTAIVAIDRVGAIGCKNALPWRLKSDMKFFRETTSENTVLMGRKTYESIGGCLPKRNNIVLSHNNVLFASSSQCQLALSVGEALFRARAFADKHTFVIGGALTYHQFAPLVDRYLVTIIDHEVADADAFLDEEVMHDIRGWDRDMLLECDASDELDDFPFQIFEICAPDIEARMARRASLIAGYEAAIPKAHKSRSVRRGNNGSLQEAFGF